MKVKREELKGLLEELIEHDRFTTDRDECVLYSRDMAPLPSLALMLFKTTPDVIIKPKTTKDVLDVIKLAWSRDIPITPRGAATYGFGGALVTKGGIVLDIRSLDKVHNLDSEGNIVTIQPGITWLKLKRYLESRGHTLLTHPSSAPSATVGGWIATGGYGYGSLKYGHILDSIVELEVVLPSGRVVVAPSEEYPLDLFIGTEGTFGVITQVKLRVRDLPNFMISKLFSFESEETLFDFISDTMSLIDAEQIYVPFSMIFSNSTFEEQKFQVGEGHGKKAQVLFRFEGEREEIKNAILVLSNLIEEKYPEGKEFNKGRLEPEPDIEKIWDERFFPLSIRKLGPTLIGQDLFIPLSKLRELNKYLEDASQRKNLQLSYEGMVVSPTSSIVLVMMLSDERKKLEYLLSMPFLNDLGKESVKLGGAPYGLGIWNSFYLENLWKLEKSDRLRMEKTRLDPNGLMNPNKVFGAKTRLGIPFSKFIFNSSMSMLKLFSPLKLASWKTSPSAQGLGDVVEDLYMCARCGYCAAVCPVYEELKSEPVALRGEIYKVKNALESGKAPPTESNVFLCTLCGRCQEYCSVRLNTLEIWSAFRRNSHDLGTGPPVLNTMTDLILKEKNPMGMSRESRLDWIDFRKRWNKRLMRRLGEDQIKNMRYSELDQTSLFKESAKTVYFAGCSASYYKRNTGIVESMTKILGDADEDFTLLGLDEWCCGEPFLLAGNVKDFKDFAMHNVEQIKRSGAQRVVFTCAGCYNTFKKEYPKLIGEDLGFKVIHSSELIEELFDEGKLKLGKTNIDLGEVTYHDPCEIGRHCDIYNSPRRVMELLGLNFTEMEDNQGEARCCGGGGLMKAVNRGLESLIANKRLDQAEAIGAKSVISGCPSCKMTLSEAADARGTGINTWDLAEVTAYSLGILPPEIKRR
jgi:Fe-S oxidoreductase/FAD/FMN-containing dehydrogenase